mgnify:CR=1 FL=1
MSQCGGRVLVVEDEPRQREILQLVLEREGHEVVVAESAERAAALIRAAAPDVLLTDLRLPGKDGIWLLEETARIAPGTGTILVTAHGTIDNAVEAMKKGAFDYLTKPLERAAVVLAVRRALEKTRLVRENAALKQQLADRFALPNIVGEHGSMQDVARLVAKVAPSGASVLIVGESGTGKELVARAIHYASPRSGREMLALNCAALPETLLESELFGHEKGAFTGAEARKIGLFEQAHGSTLFLDEVGDLSPLTQAKLLRALQEGEIRRLGGEAVVSVDVRIVAATNRDLARLIAEGRFREDLFYRLNVVTIALPALRERRTDVPLLVRHFLGRRAAEAGRAPRLADDALAALVRYDWPGNVRQLESVVERAALLAEGDEITLGDLPQEIRRPPDPTVPGFTLPDEGIRFEELERGLIVAALAKAGTVSGAARLLGLTRRTLQYRMEKFGVPSPAPSGAPLAPDGEPDEDEPA